jgi:hypothetical protein
MLHDCDKVVEAFKKTVLGVAQLQKAKRELENGGYKDNRGGYKDNRVSGQS